MKSLIAEGLKKKLRKSPKKQAENKGWKTKEENQKTSPESTISEKRTGERENR